MVRKTGRADLSKALGTIGEEEAEPKEIKIKRCYMFTEKQVSRILLLKARLYKGMDYSDIMGICVDDFFEKMFPDDKEN